MTPPGDMHADSQASILYYLKLAALEGLGKVRGDVGVILSRDPDTVVGPDAAFILTASLPLKISPEGYLETIPDIVVEIRSKNDSMPEVEDKVADYLAAGVKLVWVIDSAKDSIYAYEPTGRTILKRGDVLTTSLLPTFRVPVEKLLEE